MTFKSTQFNFANWVNIHWVIIFYWIFNYFLLPNFSVYTTFYEILQFFLHNIFFFFLGHSKILKFYCLPTKTESSRVGPVEGSELFGLGPWQLLACMMRKSVLLISPLLLSVAVYLLFLPFCSIFNNRRLPRRSRFRVSPQTPTITHGISLHSSIDAVRDLSLFILVACVFYFRY